MYPTYQIFKDPVRDAFYKSIIRSAGKQKELEIPFCVDPLKLSYVIATIQGIENEYYDDLNNGKFTSEDFSNPERTFNLKHKYFNQMIEGIKEYIIPYTDDIEATTVIIYEEGN